MDLILQALKENRTTLSEHESKKVLEAYGIPVTREREVGSEDECLAVARSIGLPVVLKGSAPEISHKTEKNLVRVDLRSEAEIRGAFSEIRDGVQAVGGTVLVSEMVPGERELVAGMVRDPQFGPSVMFGLGGIFTEILEDVAFRVAPLTRETALELMDSIRAKKILGPVRSHPPVDREALAEILVSVGKIALDHPEVAEIDINPLKLRGGAPIAVDALIVLSADAHG